MNFQGPIIGLAILGIVGLGSLFYGKHLGYQERKTEDEQALLAHKIKEDKLIKEVEDARIQREDKYRKGSEVIKHAPDPTNCFDAPIPDAVFRELLDAANR
jgi:hypothetical protein